MCTHRKYTQYANWEINLQRCHKILISDYENNHSLYTAAPSPQKKKILRGGGGCTQAELIRFRAKQGRKQSFWSVSYRRLSNSYSRKEQFHLQSAFVLQSLWSLENYLRERMWPVHLRSELFVITEEHVMSTEILYISFGILAINYTFSFKCNEAFLCNKNRKLFTIPTSIVFCSHK